MLKRVNRVRIAAMEKPYIHQPRWPIHDGPVSSRRRPERDSRARPLLRRKPDIDVQIVRTAGILGELQTSASNW